MRRGGQTAQPSSEAAEGTREAGHSPAIPAAQETSHEGPHEGLTVFVRVLAKRQLGPIPWPQATTRIGAEGLPRSSPDFSKGCIPSANYRPK